MSNLEPDAGRRHCDGPAGDGDGHRGRPSHFLLGALMAFGIGLYAPSLILLSLLGLDPRLAFPIMMSACAFLMPTTGFSFMQDASAST